LVLDGFSDEATLVVVAPWLTACGKGSDELGAKLVSPLYNAVIVFAPTASVFVTHVAFPEAGTTAVALAVNVPFAPVLEGLADELSATAVAPRLTIWVGADAVEAVKLASPL